ncbi:ROK family protein [Streptomyces afghaniensis]|uniref:ROK family protein n=1 Tax=Streptomyces afghaniensis TaxID=66865 RepID=UPI0037CE2385
MRATGPESVRGTAAESLRGTAADVLRGAAAGSVRETAAGALRGAGPESVRETVTEALRDAAAETARETATEALRATGPESVRGTAAEASRGAAAETARETAAEALRATGPESLRGTVTESAGEAATEVSRATGPEAVPAAADVLPAGPSLGPGGFLLGVGVALPGPLDHVRGVLHRVTGFPEWDGFPLREALAARLGVPVVVDKDTNAAALGLAAGGESGSFAYLHLGTGLGAGLVIGGSVHRGARTGAGEFGHQVIQLDGPPCTCGDRGCVEALCLGAVARGDVEEAARVLGAGAANLVGLLDIDVVLLGGRTVASAPEAFVRGVGAVLAARARRTGEDAVPVRVAPGGGRVVAAGAAQLVLGPVFGRGVA